MNFNEILNVLVQGFSPVAMLMVVSSITFTLFCTLVSRQSVKTVFPFILAFGMLGGLVGHSVGASRIPVVGVVLPAVLVFCSGFLVYIFGKEQLRIWRMVVPFCLLVLSVNAWIGLFIGSQMRGKAEAFEREYKEWLLHHEKVTLELEREAKLREMRSVQ